MIRLADVRVPCIGMLCGKYQVISLALALQVIDSEGNYKDCAVGFYCSECMNWFNRETGGLFLRKR